MNKKELKKILSIVLAISLMISSINYSSKAEEVSNNETSADTAASQTIETSKIVKEDMSLRTTNSSTYILENGNKMLELFGGDVRYESNGQFVDYDSSLSKISKKDENSLKDIAVSCDVLASSDTDNYFLVNKSGDSKQYFAKDLSEDTPVVLTKDEYVIVFFPTIGTDLTEKEGIVQNDIVFSESDDNKIEYEIITTDELAANADNKVAGKEITIENEAEGETERTTQIKTSSANEEEADNIKYAYTSENYGVKEEIVLSSNPDSNKFEFNLDTDRLNASLDDYGNVLLTDNESHELKAVIPAPNVRDEDGEVSYEDVSYNLSGNGGTYNLEVVVNEDYLEHANYPVVIDPTFTWNCSSACSAPAGMPATYRLETGFDENGNESAEYFYYTSALQDLQGKYIERATFNATIEQIYENPTIKIRNAETSWNFTGSNKKYPTLSDDSFGTYEFTTEQAEDQISIDLTDIVRHQAFGNTTYGMAFVTDYNESNPYVSFYGYAVSGKQPSMQIEYCDAIDVDAIYQADFDITTYYDNENSCIDINFDKYNDATNEYGVFVRENEGNFKCVGVVAANNQNEEITDTSGEANDGTSGQNEDMNEEVNDSMSEQSGEVDEAVEEEALKFVYSIERTSDDIPTLQKLDIRVAALNTPETGRLSNIVTFERESEEETEVEDAGNVSTVTVYSYNPTSIDTDGDGLEDGYEIWDFKTLYNTQTINSGTGSLEYDKDSDDDGLDDGYEVLYQGTDPTTNSTTLNGNEVDSDGDGMSDILEYIYNTDPWLADSDFDTYDDLGESGTDFSTAHLARKTASQTDRTIANATAIHVGIYDRTYTENVDGVIITYVENIYSGLVKSIDYDYGDATLNKHLKYFYDKKGNNTAIIESYDVTEPNNPYNNSGASAAYTVCITYTYDENNNVTYICDQSTKYNMYYDQDGNLTNFLIGYNENVGTSIEDKSFVIYNKTNVVNNEGTDGDTSDLSDRDLIRRDEETTSYKNGKSVRNVIFTYKVESEDDITSEAKIIDTYLDGASNASYQTRYNQNGDILQLTDYTEIPNVKTYDYSYFDNGMSVSRNDGFEITKTESDNEENGTHTSVTAYSYVDVAGNSVNNQSTSISQETYCQDDTLLSETLITLNNSDTYESVITNEGSVSTSTLKKSTENEEAEYNIAGITFKKVSNTDITYDIDLHNGTDKMFEYIYDLAGNISEIKQDDLLQHKYIYDPHGRLTKEYDYVAGKIYVFKYNSTGNMYSKQIYSMSENGNEGALISNKAFVYGNSSWSDQLTGCNGTNITYDALGNPIDYRDGMSFAWERGRSLKRVKFSDNSTATYKYNENGLRTYKSVSRDNTVTTYEWDENTLIRETVTDNTLHTTYDIWYMYDTTGSILGYQYSYLDSANEKQTETIYYEKNYQGDIIGLLDENGTKIATYSYDAWGNISTSNCISGNEEAYNLNHIGYRGYYRDNETGLYYLQSRYYDSETGRFISADDVSYLGIADNVVSKDNLYCYCNGNPVNNLDPTGKASHKKKYSFNYNRTKARKYMVKYYKYPNPDYLYFGSDCTNYASQILYAANVPMVEKSSGWYFHYVNDCFGEYSTSWTTVLDNRKFVRPKLMGNFTTINRETSDKVTKKYMEKIIKSFNPQVGDIIYFYNREKKKYSHTAVISSVKKDDILYSGHSNSCLDKSLRGRLNENKTYCHVEICHIKKKGEFYM